MAITGPSGSGKSTLLRLLAREIEPTQGMISVERPDAMESAPGSPPMYCGECILFVAQESHIFHTTLRENLLMAKPDATEQEPQRVLAAVCLTNLLEGLEQGLDTQPGEHGDLLSGGVRRRLSIARALLILPDILLLDEPTAGVDGAIARQMLSTIRALLPESTIVVATHDSWLVTTAEQHIRLHTTANRTAMESIGGISKDLSDGLGVAL